MLQSQAAGVCVKERGIEGHGGAGHVCMRERDYFVICVTVCTVLIQGILWPLTMCNIIDFFRVPLCTLPVHSDMAASMKSSTSGKSTNVLQIFHLEQNCHTISTRHTGE